MGMEHGDRFYYVLYSNGVDHQKLKSKIENKLSGTYSEAFIPYMEYYKRGDKAVKTRPMFPNYIFIYTDIGAMDLHKRVREVVSELKKGIRELGFKEQYFGQTIDWDTMTEDELIMYPNISEKEASFLELLRSGNGLLSMSKGYEVSKGKYVVMEGPLQAYEDKIIDVDKHNRKAFLKFEINGRCAQAGFECKPKAYWFPKIDSKIAVLSDGTEVDLEELKQNVMKI